MMDQAVFLDHFRDVAVLGFERLPASSSRDRLVQTAAFMVFVKAEMAHMSERWNAHRET